MREQFTDEEWSLFKHMPFAIFAMVAGADGKIDDREMAQLTKEVENAEALRTPLLRELLADITKSDLPTLIVESLDTWEFEHQAAKMRDTLKEKLGADEYQRFVVSLFLFGLNIAKASGGGFLGLGAKICQEEKDALTKFGLMFGVNPNAVVDAL